MKFVKRVFPAIAAFLLGLGLLRWLDKPSQPSSLTEYSDQSTDAQCQNQLRPLEGKTVQTRFGPVRVIGSVNRDGVLCSVNAVDYPTEDRRSGSISQTALPVLNSSALEVSSTNFDAVSGATYTSDGYKESLQSLLDKR